uniref:Uncharacterized protein n=1 Tax=Arundo donax TaxID=35708 RepID=A0A0A9A7W4_ARUDO
MVRVRNQTASAP